MSIIIILILFFILVWPASEELRKMSMEWQPWIVSATRKRSQHAHVKLSVCSPETSASQYWVSWGKIRYWQEIDQSCISFAHQGPQSFCQPSPLHHTATTCALQLSCGPTQGLILETTVLSARPVMQSIHMGPLICKTPANMGLFCFVKPHPLNSTYSLFWSFCDYEWKLNTQLIFLLQEPGGLMKPTNSISTTTTSKDAQINPNVGNKLLKIDSDEHLTLPMLSLSWLWFSVFPWPWKRIVSLGMPIVVEERVWHKIEIDKKRFGCPFSTHPVGCWMWLNVIHQTIDLLGEWRHVGKSQMVPNTVQPPNLPVKKEESEKLVCFQNYSLLMQIFFRTVFVFVISTLHPVIFWYFVNIWYWLYLLIAIASSSWEYFLPCNGV